MQKPNDFSRYDKLGLTQQEKVELAAFDASIDNSYYLKNRESDLRRKRELYAERKVRRNAATA